MQWELIDELTLPVSRGLLAPNLTVLISRAQVPGGWLILTVTSVMDSPPTTMTFYPDPDHAWNGGKA